MSGDKYFLNLRQEWIEETVSVFGFINRVHIMRKFRISQPQASLDIRLFIQRNPDRIKYNVNTKRYEGKPFPLTNL